MRVNQTICLATLTFTALSCGSETHQDAVQTPEDKVAIVEYSSDLRPGVSEWDMNQTFVDTVDFVSYDDNGDYAYLSVRTNIDKGIDLVTDVEIDVDYLTGKQMIIEWKLDSLFEAGEGDELYYQERVISVEPYGSAHDFTQFFESFQKDYVNRDLEKYLHPEFDLIYGFNPGAYCIQSDQLPEVYLGDMNSVYPIKNEAALGDFCEGYESPDGYYFQFIEEKDYPVYADLTGDDFTISSPVLNVPYDEVVRVLLVTDHYFNRYLYFFKSEGQWFFWIEHFCDCSA